MQNLLKTNNSATALGLLAAGVALIFAYLMPEFRDEIVSGAGIIAVLALLFDERAKIGQYQPVGYLGAGACMVAAIFMPDVASELVHGAGIIAVLTVFFL